MHKLLILFIVSLSNLSLILFAFILPFSLSRADELEDVAQQLNQQQQQLADLEKRKVQLAKAIASASLSLAQVSTELSQAEVDLTKISEELSAREETLTEWEATRNTLIREFYKQSRVSPFEIVFSSDSILDSTRQLQYYQENLGVLKGNITALVGEIAIFKENKAKAEQLKNDLAALRAQYQAALASSQRQLSAAKSQVSEVQKIIGQLTARQQQLLAEKFGSVATTVGDIPPSSDNQLAVNPGFSPAYAGFSFGAPHHVGMSQYGAYGRSKAGQSYQQILNAYYANITLTRNYPAASQIHVVGKTEWNCPVPGGYIDQWVDLEEYVKGIWEMPRSWPLESLKAQAVAARTYALYQTGNGTGTIQPNQNAQVYCPLAYKSSSYDGAWYKAVDDTKGEVMLYGGSPIGAFYASTSGGYTYMSCDTWGGSCRPWTKRLKDWDNPNAPLQEIFQRAYEGVSYGSSPWFYKAWYKGCSGRPHAWLNSNEFVDVVNATLLYSADSSTKTHLSQLDKSSPATYPPSCPYPSTWPDTWSAERVRQELINRGRTPVASVSNVISSLSEDREYGYTKWVYLYTNIGTLTIDGPTFYAIFNIRAPAEIHLKSIFYKIEPK